MTNHPNRSRRGRPPKREGEHHARLTITISPDALRRLDDSPLGRSREIDRLIMRGLAEHPD